MAVSVGISWTVRDDGNDSNGGGFNTTASGTDGNNSASPIATLTTATVVNSTTTQLNVAAGNYTVAATDVGNLVNITGGTATAGRYEITAVDIPNNRWTVDRSMGTVGQTASGRMGGALLTIAQYFISQTGAPSNTLRPICWIKGTFTLTATQNLGAVDGHDLRGYSTSRGDNGRATITTATNSVPLFTYNTGRGAISWKNIKFSNSAGTRAAGFQGASAVVMRDMRFHNCQFDGLASVVGRTGTAAAQQVYLNRCEVKNSSTAGVSLNAASGTLVWMFDCWVHDNFGDGVLDPSSNHAPTYHYYQNCVFSNNAGRGLYLRNQSPSVSNDRTNYFIKNCTFYSNDNSGLEITTVASQEAYLNLYNNIFYGNGTSGSDYGASFNALGFLTEDNYANAYGSNNGGARNNISAGLNSSDVALSADPFTNAAGDDYTLNNTAGGGAACRNVGIPSTVVP